MFNLPPTCKLEIRGERIECLRTGSGAVTVVLINGSGGPIEGWHKILGPVAEAARVFAYNRPGVGGSAPPAVPQTAAHMAASLRDALDKSGCSPPYVLVGHSFGGIIANRFARCYPEDVGAVVMLEASTAADIESLPAFETRPQRFIARLAERIFPSNPNAEALHADASAHELRHAPPFPQLPLIVITGARPAMAWATRPEALAARARHQQQLAALSPLGRQVIAARSGHFPQFTEPGLVVSAVKEAIDAALSRAGAALPS